MIEADEGNRVAIRSRRNYQTNVLRPRTAKIPGCAAISEARMKRDLATLFRATPKFAPTFRAGAATLRSRASYVILRSTPLTGDHREIVIASLREVEPSVSPGRRGKESGSAIARLIRIRGRPLAAPLRSGKSRPCSDRKSHARTGRATLFRGLGGA